MPAGHSSLLFPSLRPEVATPHTPHLVPFKTNCWQAPSTRTAGEAFLRQIKVLKGDEQPGLTVSWGRARWRADSLV